MFRKALLPLCPGAASIGPQMLGVSLLTSAFLLLLLPFLCQKKTVFSVFSPSPSCFYPSSFFFLFLPPSPLFSLSSSSFYFSSPSPITHPSTPHLLTSILPFLSGGCLLVTYRGFNLHFLLSELEHVSHLEIPFCETPLRKLVLPTFFL